MSQELKDYIEALGHYYRHHKIAKVIENNPGFAAEDFARLLAKLHIENIEGIKKEEGAL